MVRRSKFIKFSSLRETTMIARGWRLSTNALSSLWSVSGWIIIVWITIIKLVHADSVLLSCQCSATESVFRPNGHHHGELRTPINVSALCSVHVTKNYPPQFFQKNKLRINHCMTQLETLWIHAVSHHWESVDQILQLSKEVVRVCHKNEKRVYAPKWKLSLPWNATKNRVTISWLLPP